MKSTVEGGFSKYISLDIERNNVLRATLIGKQERIHIKIRTFVI